MPAQWTCDIVGQMHKYKISKTELAARIGVSREYVSAILNGHRNPAGAEEKFRKALDALISEQPEYSTQ